MRHHPLTRRFFTFGLIAMFAGFAFFAVGSAQATTIVPSCARINATDPPSLRCALLTFTNVATLIVGVTGSFALLMFVYGGFTLLTSGGSADGIKKGKDILKNAIIGMVLIFTAGYIIDYAVKRLQGRQYVPEDTSCNDGAGTWKRTDARGLYCESQCTHASIRALGYRCMNPEPGEGGGPPRGTNCNLDYLCGAAGSPTSQCCIPTTVCLGGTSAGASCTDIADCPMGRCEPPPADGGGTPDVFE